jgi:hypothetical protein
VALARWFVEYNPLYFASALCILAGIFLVAREAPPEAFVSKLAIVASTEVYQLLLIAGAALLLRAGLARPAAILGLLAVVFILDIALNGERLLSHVGVLSLEPGMRARRAVPASLAVALLGPAKILLLSRVFRLRSSGLLVTVTGLTAFFLPLLPYAVELAGPAESLRQDLHLSIFWMGAPLLGWALSKGASGWTSEWAATASDPRIPRLARIVPFLAVGLFVIHGLAWSAFPGLILSPALAAPYFLAAFSMGTRRLAHRLSRQAEPTAWAGAALALWSAAGAPAPTGLWPLATVSLLTGGTLLFLAKVARLRLLLPATGCLLGGAYTLSTGAVTPLPLPGPAWPALATGLFLAGAWIHRDFRCLVASALSAGATAWTLGMAARGLPAAGMVAGLWLAGTSWVLFPDLRRWVPFAGTLVVLALGTRLVLADPSGFSPWYAGYAVATAAVGVAGRRGEYLGAGLSAGAVLATLKRGAWLPHTGGGWGIALLAAGFLLLALGVGINLALVRRQASHSEPEPTGLPPAP